MINDNHPELREGERLIANTASTTLEGWAEYKTKRLGDVAYSMFDDVVPGLRPLFVSKKEYERLLK